MSNLTDSQIATLDLAAESWLSLDADIDADYAEIGPALDRIAAKKIRRDFPATVIFRILGPLASPERGLRCKIHGKTYVVGYQRVFVHAVKGCGLPLSDCACDNAGLWPPTEIQAEHKPHVRVIAPSEVVAA